MEVIKEQAIEAEQLNRVLPQWMARDSGIYVLYPNRRYLPAKVRLFLDFIKEYLPTEPR